MTLTPSPSVPVDDGTEDFLRYVRTGDTATLEALLVVVAPKAYTQAWRTLGNPADAEDAVQEAVIQLLRTAGQYDGRIPFPAWLGRLVQVACWRFRRQETRLHQREQSAMPHTVTPTDADLDLPHHVREAVASLSEADRTAIELHYFAGMSQASAAAALGLREGTLAMRLSRARDRLGRILAGRGVTVGAAALIGLLANPTSPAAESSLLEKIQRVMPAPGSPPPVRVPVRQGWSWTHGLGLGAAALAASVGLVALSSTTVQPQPRGTHDQDTTVIPLAQPVVTAALPIAATAPRVSTAVTPPPPSLVPPDPSLVTLKVERMKIAYVCAWIANTTHQSIELVDVPDQAITADFVDVPLADALKKLADMADSTVEHLANGGWRLTGKAGPASPKAGG